MGQLKAGAPVRLTRVYVPEPLPRQGEFALSRDVANHLVRVMRLQDGEEFVAFDGSGVEVRALLHRRDKGKTVWGEVQECAFPPVEMAAPLTLYLAVVKGERFDWAIEKATELGVARLVPLVTEFTAVRPTGRERLERWQRLAESAACQSGRVCVPRVETPVSFAEAIELERGQRNAIFVPRAPLVAESMAVGPWNLFVGPEGGFSPSELAVARQNNWLEVGLGPRILRVETAAMAALCLFGSLR